MPFSKNHGNMMFSMYSVKMVLFFLQTWNYPSVKKAKIIFFQKNTLKNGASGITKKGDAHPSKDDIGIGD